MVPSCRLLTAVALAVAPVAACGSSGAPSRTEAGPAGDVRAATGEVTVRRGATQPRPLAVGDAVAADDVVATGVDGTCVIELRRNGARWSLGPGVSRKVSDSLAWGAPRQAGAPSADRTTAAGRAAERAAADTAATAATRKDDAPGGGSGDHEAGQVGTPVFAFREGGGELVFTLRESAGPRDAAELAAEVGAVACPGAPTDTVVRVTLVVDADGAVSRADVDAVGSAGAFGDCLVRELRAARLSAAAGPTTYLGEIRVAQAL